MTSPSKPHYDLLSGTGQLLNDCGYSIHLEHIKGHQDNGVITVLTCAATLNIKADLLAKAKLAHYVKGPPMYYLPLAYGTCYVNQQHVVKNIQSTLRNHTNGSLAIKYWQQCHHLLALIWSTIDWSSFNWAMLEIPLHCRCWVSKFVSGHFAHGKNMQCWCFWSSASCPWCKCPLEDKPHIIRCPAPTVVEKWSSSLKALKLWLQDQNTLLVILEALLYGLQAWYSNNPPPMASHNGTHLVEDQSNIGWVSLIDGWLALSWHLEQEQYWSCIWTRKSSNCWTSELIKKLWDIAWDLWDQCNEALHANPSNHDILGSQANDQIRLVYMQGSTMLPCDALHQRLWLCSNSILQ